MKRDKYFSDQGVKRRWQRTLQSHIILKCPMDIVVYDASQNEMLLKLHLLQMG